MAPCSPRTADETGIGAAGAALLTTVPVLYLGLASAFGPAAMRRYGIDAGVLAGIVVVALSLAVRGLGGVAALFAESALAACGIGIAGVLLPALVKRDFPRNPGTMTGLYTMVLCIGAAAGARPTVLLAQATGLGWAETLALWTLPALAAALVLAPFIRRASAPAALPGARPNLRRHGLA